MTSAIYQISDALSFMRVSTGGSYTALPGGAVIKRRLPTDPIGSTSVTFTGVLEGTEIHVYLQDGTELTGVESSTANPVLSWLVYSSGPNSTVYITLIKRGYRWQRFDYTPRVGSQSIQIFPLPDLGYNNPI